jgi:hypothetical protein
MSESRAYACAALGLALFSCGCGGGGTTTTASRNPVVVVSSPTPAATPTPSSAIQLPAGMVCSDPTPPPMLRMQLKIHAVDGNRTILDSKPLVPNVNHYCEKVGFGDWKFCDTRPEGTPERVACDYLVTGMSPETGRWGPTWYYNDVLCGTDPTVCVDHPTEQFLTVAKAKGPYEACASEDTPVDSEGSRCGEIDVQ